MPKKDQIKINIDKAILAIENNSSRTHVFTCIHLVLDSVDNYLPLDNSKVDNLRKSYYDLVVKRDTVGPLNALQDLKKELLGEQ